MQKNSGAQKPSFPELQKQIFTFLKGRPNLQKLSLTVFGLLLVFFLLEISLRVYYQAAQGRLLGLTPARTTIRWRDDPVLGRRLVPSQSGWFVPDSREYYTWITVNAKGWRDSEHSLKKPQDTFRVLIIGDSFVENFQVPLEQTFFKQLEKGLNEQMENGRAGASLGSGKIEVVALGLGDSGTAQQFLVLKEYGIRYSPDLVIHMFFVNDVKNNSPTLMGDPHRPYFKLTDSGPALQPFTPRTSTPKGKLFSFLKTSSRVTELLFDLKGRLDAGKTSPHDYPVDYHVYDEEYSNEYKEAWKATKALILESKNLAKEGGADYILVSIPAKEQVDENMWQKLRERYPALAGAGVDPEKPDKVLYEFCEKEQINCLFLLPFFKEYVAQNPLRTTYYPIDGHWAPEGTNLTAEVLTQALKELISSNPQQ